MALGTRADMAFLVMNFGRSVANMLILAGREIRFDLVITSFFFRKSLYLVSYKNRIPSYSKIILVNDDLYENSEDFNVSRIDEILSCILRRIRGRTIHHPGLCHSACIVA